MKKSLILLLLSIFLGSTLEAFVGINPTIVEIKAEKGKTYKGAFTVTNTKSSPITVKSEMTDWWKEQTGNKSMPPEKWLKVKGLKSFVLKPGASKKIKYKVKLKEELNGEAAAMLFFSFTEPKSLFSSMNMQMRHGVPIYVISEKTANPDVSIGSIEAGFEVSIESATIMNIAVDMRNNGNVHTRPRGTVSISSGENKLEDCELEYGWPLYPGANHRYLTKTTERRWIPGHYTAEIAAQTGEILGKDITIKKTIELNITAEGKIEILQ